MSRNGTTWQGVMILFGTVAKSDPSHSGHAKRCIKAALEYWFCPRKEPYLTHCSDRLTEALHRLADDEDVPEWLTRAHAHLSNDLSRQGQQLSAAA